MKPISRREAMESGREKWCPCHGNRSPAGCFQNRLKALGVRRVAPTHCTGDTAGTLFTAVYGDRFQDSGTGRVIAGMALS